MKKSEKQNTGHSVFQRLLNISRTNREDFNLLLLRYGIERLLYRLSISSHKDRFVLKGASLFLVWKGHNYRVTKDADLLGFGDPDANQIAEVFKDICQIACSQDDGMIYLTESLKTEVIREDQEYDGVRITLTGLLHQARIPLQIDVGFGDTITPEPEFIEFPTLIEMPAPNMKAYPRYTLVAEKLEAIVRLGLANSRMKDFYDIWLVSKLFDFDGKILCQAISNTFKRRNTRLPEKEPFAFTSEFYEDQQKKQQWKAFVKKTKPEDATDDFGVIVAKISEFLTPVLRQLQNDEIFEYSWLKKKGWSQN
jgi:hypothetical protein